MTTRMCGPVRNYTIPYASMTAGPIPANQDFGHFHIEIPEDSTSSSDEHHETF